MTRTLRFLPLFPLLLLACCDPDADIFSAPSIPKYTPAEQSELAREMTLHHDTPMMDRQLLDYNALLMQIHAVFHTDG